MELTSLGYVGVSTARIDEWAAFAGELLGLQVVRESKSSLSLRMDDFEQRLMLDRGETERCECFGWEVADSAALERVAARLEAAGAKVTAGSATLTDRRRVQGLITFADPAGNRLEVFHGPTKAVAPFVPGRNISGFRTGALGLGHVVLTCESIEQLTPFYQDVLGFRLSDYTLSPFKAFFFHINARHHSLALVETGKNGVHHVMLEMLSLDDVGQGYDLALCNPQRVGVSLGRHTNDLITSFYAKTPSHFMIECGWGGRNIDVNTWQPFECDYGPSLWGHERSWLDAERRTVARELRLAAARLGRRAPVQVLKGNHELMDDGAAVKKA